MSVTQSVSLGQAAESVRGRDLHKAYLIVGIQDRSVWLANGRERLVGHPKKKNIRHIKTYARTFASIAEKLAQNRPVSNEEVREALRSLWPKHEQRAEEEEIACPSRT